MSYFYVKSGFGTRTTGGGTTKQSGSFASLGAANVYATYADAVADGAGSGDIVCFSHLHYETNAGFTLNGPQSGDGLQLQCVDDTACETPYVSTAANFNNSGGGSALAYDGIFYLYGVWSKSNNDISVAALNTFSISEDCTFQATGASDVCMNISADGAYHLALNPTFVADVTTVGLIQLSQGSVIEVCGGSVDPTVKPTSVIRGAGARGFTARLNGVDFTNVTDYILENIGGTIGSDDNINVTMQGCKVAAGLTAFVEEEFTNYTHRFQAYNCSSDSAAAEYQFHIEGYGGYVDDQDDAGIHRDESIAFPGGEKVSAHCVTNTKATICTPFWFDLPAPAVDLSQAASDTLRIYLASTASLTDLDVWVEVMYPDGTNKQTWNRVTTRNSDRLAASGTALTTDSGSTWKNGASDLTGYNEYYIDVDTSGDAGADCVPIIRVFVAKASTTIYFDVKVDAV
ncbi:hypothetical protein HBA55_29625 [Pseudomaricurvus alkylphenolicus]|uniref:hypothetical protein n=1 Tax=Pseudomaricurvus alkylphenolicus TaxID=1306991 RepID=UPI00141DF86B|nr:hypothetical protein [Pseudomaricurvus alkylphenolicus]NIB43799.1 hypothetical protein [Pseudomaricurvus alkylphenolicus]